jgi:hypothetical protein
MGSHRLRAGRRSTGQGAGEEEEARFKVSVEGKEVISTFYKEGGKAREFLSKCMAGQPTK